MIIGNRDRKVNDSKMSLLLWWPRKDALLAFSHYSDVIISKMASQINSVSMVYSTVQGQIKENIKLRVTGLCEGNSPVTGEFPAEMASSAEMFPFDDVIIVNAISVTRQDGNSKPSPPFVNFVNCKIITSWTIGNTEVEKTQSGIIIVDYAN